MPNGQEVWGGRGRQAPPNKEGKATQIIQIETVVFIPATPGSELKARLQRQDNIMCQASNCPKVRFLERAGTTLIEELGKNNPWASEWYCPRQDCLPYQGRMELAAEAEEEAGKILDKS